MASHPRVRLDPEDRRAQLIALGLEILSAKPAAQVAVDDVAEAAGISRGLLFHYFASKRDFQLAVVEAAAAELLRVTEPDGSLPELEQLSGSLDAFVSYIEDKHELYVALVRGSAGADPDLHAIFEENRNTVADRVCQALGEAGTHPALRTAVRGWIAFCEEATLHWVAHRTSGREQLVHLCEQLLVTAVVTVLPEEDWPEWYSGGPIAAGRTLSGTTGAGEASL